MNSSIPRIMIAAPSSGSGKTTIVCGVLKLLLNKGLSVTSFKCGPDYIDPMFHSKVIGVKSRNLDLFLNDENTVKNLLIENSKNSDIAVIEGVMGFYDGLAGKSLTASSYHLSKVTKTPTILVINSKGKSRSIVAEIKGFLDYKQDSNIKGVILNNMSSMIYPSIKEIIEEELNISVIGYVPKNSDFSIESRHLGLVTADEIKDLEQRIGSIAKALEETIDINKLISIANCIDKIECSEIKIPKVEGVNIAIARDKAFCFYYEDNINLLKLMGANIIEFSPLKDSLPKNIHGLIIGGGYPELYAKALSENTTLLNEIKERLSSGLPCLAECGGFMYLGKSIKGDDGQVYPMVDYFNHESFNTNKLSRFGYVNLVANKDNLLCTLGEEIKAHEFHYYDSTENGETFNARKPLGKRNWNCIREKNNTLAGYPHIHYYSNINFPYNFLKKCVKYREEES